MTTNPSWSVKGIEPEARAAAKAAAKREGLTLGAWLSRAIARSDTGAGPDLGARMEGIEQGLGDLARRIESVESTRRLEVALARSSGRRWRTVAVGAAVVAVLAVGTTAVGPFMNRPVGERMTAKAVVEAPAMVAPAPAPEPEPLATAEAEPGKFAAIAAPVADPAAGEERQEAEDAVTEAVVAAVAVAVAVADAPDTPSPALESASLDAVDEAPEIDAEIDTETVQRFLAAARKGSPEAQYNVGILYAEGLGVTQDYGEALAWFERAAEQGLANAQYNLAAMHEHGLAGARDAAKARQWYRRAAEQGHSQSQHNLAVIHARGGGGIAQDYTLAAKWFTAAAERGLVNAQYNLALLHERGLGVARDEALAYKWFSLAGQRGDASAGAARDALAGGLGPVERAEIDRDVTLWRPLPTRNEEAGDGGGEEPEVDGEPAMVARVQTLLADLGFDPGAADGVSGAKTRQAIRDYQRQLGLAVDGRASARLLTHLRSVTGD
jgi:localization factor PodJL